MRERVKKGVTQEELADAVGVTQKTIWLLESAQVESPNLRLLMNCAIALQVDLDRLIEPMWRQWKVFRDEKAEPPDPSTFLKPGTMRVPKWVEDFVEPPL